MKSTLVAALSDCVDRGKRRMARRFLQGLSADELQYIAEFLGACILESRGECRCNRGQLAEGITEFERSRYASAGCSPRTQCAPQDRDHKMILLLEYLCRSGLTRYSLAVKAGRA